MYIENKGKDGLVGPARIGWVRCVIKASVLSMAIKYFVLFAAQIQIKLL